MLKQFIVTSLLIVNFCYSQIIGGASVFSFLNASANPQQTALGGKVLTLVDDVDQPTWNPATINLNIDRYIAVNYTSYLANISVGSISYAHRFSRHTRTFHSNITYINYGSLIGADTEGNETGTFNAGDFALSIGHSFIIPGTDIHTGANIKFIYSSIAGFSSEGFAVDLGAVYYNTNKPYVFSLVLRNIGTQLTSFNGKTEKLPFEIALGGSYLPENVPLRWYITIDNIQQWNISVPNPSGQTSDLDGTVTGENISFIDNAFRHFIIGAELFPKRAVNLRVGYNFKRGKELQLQNIRTFGGISFGFGLRMNKVKLNYAYSRFHTASNVNTFGISINLNKQKLKGHSTKY